MPRRYYYGPTQDDDDAQVDGEGSPHATAMRAQPWVRMSGLTPWHMWGNSIALQPFELLEVPEGTTSSIEQSGQLIKVAYKRPESWHWLFHARFISAVDGGSLGPGLETLFVNLEFDIIIGHGRSQVELRAFERFRWKWKVVAGTTPPFPPSMWSTSASTPNLNFVQPNVEIPVEPEVVRPIDQLVGEDIQCRCRAFMTATGPFPVFLPIAPTQLEVSAFFAPKVHVRPDWMQVEVPPEAQFPGEEIRGR